MATTEALAEAIKKQLSQYEEEIKVDEIGAVTYLGDGIVRASGLNNAMYGELVKFQNGVYG